MNSPQRFSDSPFIILLVDDAEDCLTTLEISLQSLPGVILRCARTAEEALQELELMPVSAIITDLHLPAMNGLELIGRVRKQPGFRSLPIVVVSASADPAAPQNALASGANAYFAKPFSPAALRRKLEEFMYA